jgi:hypothetical protein
MCIMHISVIRLNPKTLCILPPPSRFLFCIIACNRIKSVPVPVPACTMQIVTVLLFIYVPGIYLQQTSTLLSD